MSSLSTQSILKQLVAIRSDVDPDKDLDERDMIAYVARWFESCPGWSVTQQRVSATRQNIICRTSGEVQTVFLGHLDTVPVTSQAQLEPVVNNNRLSGRGSVDMKAGVAVMLQLATKFSQPGLACVFTVDEEYDFFGMRAFLEEYRWRPDLLVNLEPTDLRLLTQARGVAEVELELQGKKVHAARKSLGVNVIEASVDALRALETALQEVDEDLRTTLNFAGLQAGIRTTDGEIISRANVVPDAAVATIEFRLGKETTQSLLEQQLLSALTRCSLSASNLRWRFLYQPMRGKPEAVSEFTNAVENQMAVAWVDPNKSGFYEVQLLGAVWKCPIVIFGPGPSDKAHMDDEYVDLTQLLTAEKVIETYLKNK